ncbi:MAG: multicopper oxidase family protein [bacterium]|nr:MAG: multicopper oxidase family protein [bacterium]
MAARAGFFFAMLAVFTLSPLPVFAHGSETGTGGEEMTAAMVMASTAEDEYIYHPAPTGRDVVIGRANHVPELRPRILIDDQGREIKVFDLVVEDVKFEIYPGETVEGWGFNDSVPGPTIRVREGDRIRVVLTNKTKDEHTIHIHGQIKPLIMDGVPYLSQEPVHKGESYAYEFTVRNQGTHWYHCHVDSGHHVDMGMYGAFIVEPKKEKLKSDREYILILDEWPGGHRHVHGGEMDMEAHEVDVHGVVTEDAGAPRHEKPEGKMATAAAPMAKDADHVEMKAEGKTGMPMEDHGDAIMEKPKSRDWYPKTYGAYTPVYDTFTINGRAFPYTQPLEVKEGDRVRIRIINAGYQTHFMHTHSHKFLVVARDGNPVKNPQRRDTVDIGPGQRVDILLEADNFGVWPFHCHNLLHVANDDIYPGGMLTFIRYVEKGIEIGD